MTININCMHISPNIYRYVTAHKPSEWVLLVPCTYKALSLIQSPPLVSCSIIFKLYLAIMWRKEIQENYS